MSTSSDTGVTIKSAIQSTISTIETLLGISIEDFRDFATRNKSFRDRLMTLNQTIQENLNDISGDNAAYKGVSWNVDVEHKQTPSYVEDIDYYNNYAKKVSSTEYTTNMSASISKDYINHNQLYYTTENLYPDDLNVQSSRISTWGTSNQKSLLYKTRQLFHDKKIKTLISRFSSSSNGDSITEKATDTTSVFGISHGNGLLKKDAEEGDSTYSYCINGYNNPYCRVWTHHYQYDKLNKLIRPFNNGEENNSSNMTLSKFHTWSNFGDDVEGNNNDTDNKYGWKNENDGWDLSVLNKNGFVNIAPKYKGGGSDNVHTKQCMFSIENLAWQGYDPYQFEQALSWEQRGPLGGRIMWFPPYDIEFNETTQASWTNHSFIGRGEDVYTYTNTTRSGNLSFTLIADHPSIIDYVAWQSGTTNTIHDTDVLRFFAGCDSDTLRDYAKPMPLTDEYVENTTEDEEYASPELTPTESEDEPVEEVKTIHFYVFYPNNYSGYYDGIGEDVEAIAYLLDGSGTQKDENYGDISLAFENINGNNGTGYEMNAAIGNENINPIIGSSITWSKYSDGMTYQYSSTKKWYYRIDGDYEVPGSSDYYRNCYDQTLAVSKNYYDSSIEYLNSNSENVSDAMGDTEDGLYSLAEVASALMTESNRESFNTAKGINSETVEELTDIFTNYTLSAISGIGYSNSQGNNSDNSINENRNSLLAKQRAITAMKWAIAYMPGDVSSDALNFTSDAVTVEASVKINTNSISDLDAKKYRSAKITLTFNKSEKTDVSESDQVTTDSDDNTESASIQKYIGYTAKEDINGKTYYINSDNNTYWIEVEEGSKAGMLKRVELVDGAISEIDNTTSEAETERNTEGNSSGSTNNSIRYDKEYYFFKEHDASDNIVADGLLKKIQYFDPAFHSMTPEGFNARLTFLQQCTRQGNTIGASDSNSSTATNLAFGKPPFCVLRLGDFYNQMIVIDNININYENQWDLNIEGAGVQPMIAKVNISFKFIGGGDLAGPIRRLQNAMTFNYYANARLYDNRADRIKYEWSDKTCGAIDHDVNTDKSYYYSAAMYNNSEDNE